MNAIYYQNRTGCRWRGVPYGLPSWSAVFYYSGLWRVLAASAHDNAGGITLLGQAADRCGNRLEKALVDQDCNRITMAGVMVRRYLGLAVIGQPDWPDCEGASSGFAG
ncbi:hypothetical protein GCM10010277_86030 [Streptomyces longisporoflavus]|uniref:transposase n=1 Tax=Streptomyces longisporoflavus TaxID=28044 RepID=UPI0019C19A3B|nr:transposase [Streptomyces longisporoflavus]GGV72756.1 hypothetical protein GCM10010277_86030 [Streptomyces longisporoflavus]